MSYAALIPLRGGSKSIPQKNIMPLCGKPLCAWVLEAALHCPAIDEVYVSTDCPQIARTVNKISAHITLIDRPADIAGDSATTEAAMLHALPFVQADNLVTIQATSPLLTSTHLTCAIKQFEQENAQSMLSAVRTKRFYWNDDGTPINYEPQHRPMRQNFAGTLTENGAFYITRRDLLVARQCRLGGKISIFEMPANTFIEIDEPEDWLNVESLMKAEFT